MKKLLFLLIFLVGCSQGDFVQDVGEYLDHQDVYKVMRHSAEYGETELYQEVMANYTGADNEQKILNIIATEYEWYCEVSY